ncbi:MAG: phosphotransferase, partial [Oxalobacter sp.]
MSTTVPNISSDSRLALLLPWLQGLAGFNLDLASIRPASSDASFRRYFRVNSDKGSYIVMDAPPDKERIEPFIHVDELFKASGV